MGPIVLIIILFIVSFVLITFSFQKLFGIDLLNKVFNIFGNQEIIEKIIYFILALLGIYLMIVGFILIFN